MKTLLLAMLLFIISYTQALAVKLEVVNILTRESKTFRPFLDKSKSFWISKKVLPKNVSYCRFLEEGAYKLYCTFKTNSADDVGIKASYPLCKFNPSGGAVYLYSNGKNTHSILIICD